METRGLWEAYICKYIYIYIYMYREERRIKWKVEQKLRAHRDIKVGKGGMEKKIETTV